MKTWITDTLPETPLRSVDITPMWNDHLFRMMNRKGYEFIKIPTGGLYTHFEGYTITRQPVMVQCNEDCTIHLILN